MRKFKLAVLLICVMLCAAPLFACGDKLNMKNYNKIDCVTTSANGGMTLNEVKEILGEPDSNTSGAEMDITAIIYVWGNKEKNITVTFLEEIAVSKKQTGLS